MKKSEYRRQMTEMLEPIAPETDLATIPFPADNPFAELTLYCSEKNIQYRPELLGGKDEMVEREFRQFIDAGKLPEDFYRESEQCLYHWVHLETDIWSRPYRDVIYDQLPAPRTVLDFGCGAGGNGLMLAARGYDVSFADYADTRGVEFLRWRLDKRGMSNAIYALEDDIPQHDLVIAFDVLEHTPEPMALLNRLEKVGRLVAVNLLTTIPECDPTEPQLHYKLPIREIVKYIESKHIIALRDFNYAIYAIYAGDVENYEKTASHSV